MAARARPVNAKWHESHLMPRNASMDQRVVWHEAHAAACGCRPVPAGVASAMAKGRTGQRSSRRPPSR